MKAAAKSKLILNLYHSHGQVEYGEHCSVLSHSVQAGLIAQEQDRGEELILAAFLHDIGHLSPLEQDEEYQKMGKYGIDAHDKWGELILEQYGFSPLIIASVKNHVAAKRYLCYEDSEYLYELSEASKETMKYQGGIMTADEAHEFEKAPYFKESLLIRTIDDLAKEKNFEVTIDHMIYFERLLLSHLGG